MVEYPFYNRVFINEKITRKIFICDRHKKMYLTSGVYCFQFSFCTNFCFVFFFQDNKHEIHFDQVVCLYQNIILQLCWMGFQIIFFFKTIYFIVFYGLDYNQKKRGCCVNISIKIQMYMNKF